MSNSEYFVSVYWGEDEHAVRTVYISDLIATGYENIKYDYPAKLEPMWISAVGPTQNDSWKNHMMNLPGSVCYCCEVQNGRWIVWGIRDLNV